MNYYPHHIGDFRSATRHLTTVERALYRECIDIYYDTEKPLTLDFERLARLVVAHSDDEKTALKSVLDEFFTSLDDGYHNDRCDEEIAAYQSKAGRSRENGKKGGRPPNSVRNVPHGTEPRRNPDVTQTKPTNNPAGFSGLSNQNPDVTQTKANQNQNQEPKEKAARKRAASESENFDPLTLPLPLGLGRELWESWCRHRREIKKPLTPESCRRQLADLAKWRTEGHEPDEVVGEALRQGWQGLFKPKITVRKPPEDYMPTIPRGVYC